MVSPRTGVGAFSTMSNSESVLLLHPLSFHYNVSHGGCALTLTTQELDLQLWLAPSGTLGREDGTLPLVIALCSPVVLSADTLGRQGTIHRQVDTLSGKS